MAEIAVTDARGLFTKKLISVYQERIRPKNFLRSLFPNTTSPTKEVSIEVERGFEFIAKDVVRGTEGHLNTFSKATEKIFVPPLWREYFNATELDLYDRVLGSQSTTNDRLFTALMNKVGDRLGQLQDKIERAKEKQCGEVLETGIVTLVSGDNIDFKRKAASLVDLGAGQYWASAVDPFEDLQQACNFLRATGKSGDSVFNAILGEDAMVDLLNNAKFLTRQNLFNLRLDDVRGPKRSTNGAVYHGSVTAGPYTVQLWTYPDYYEDPATPGTLVPYFHAKKVAVIPLSPKFVFAHAAVPQIIDGGNPGGMPTQGEYVLGEYIDYRKAVHDFDIQSAGVPIPVAVDQIYTMQVKA